jgi:glycosyltransferase involved in cell wall biosynthesis
LIINKNLLALIVVANEAGGGVRIKTLSGGDRIIIELVKRWMRLENMKIRFIVNISGYFMYKRYLPNGKFIIISDSLRDARLSEFIPYIIFYEARLLLKSIAFILKLKRNDETPIIYSASEFLADLIPAIILKRRLGGKLIATFYLFSPNPFSNRVYLGFRKLRGLAYYIMQRISYTLIKRFADMVWVNNEYDRWKFIDGKKFTIKNVIAVGPGVDNTISREVQDMVEKKYDAVFIGRLHPQKGVLELVDIWKLVRDRKPDAKLAIIGVGYLESELRRKIKERGLTDAIDLLSFKNGIDKIKVFKASRIVLHPAIYESGGMAALEAMSCGLPGVCFDLSVYRVYYPKGMLKTPCFDLKAFADNILRLLEDAELYERLRKEALELAQEWDWDKRAEELLKIIMGLMKNE